MNFARRFPSTSTTAEGSLGEEETFARSQHDQVVNPTASISEPSSLKSAGEHQILRVFPENFNQPVAIQRARNDGDQRAFWNG